MPPRRRTPTQPPQDSRMAAAIEAMAEFGFEAKLVRKKVSQLLKEDVYGEEGWHFIEEYCYSTLIEVLLADQTNVGNISLENPNDRKYAETAGAGPSSNKAIFPRKSCLEKETETSGAGQSSKDLSAQAEPRGTQDTEPSIARQPKNSSRKVTSVEINPSRGSELETTEHVISSSLEAVNRASQITDVLDSASLDKAMNNSTPTELLGKQGQKGTQVTDHAQHVATLPTKRRRPYYGWIGCEDDDFVILTETPLPEVLRKMFILDMDFGDRKRKSRWDVQP